MTKKNVPQKVVAAANRIRKQIHEIRMGDHVCTRCDGEGSMNENEGWVVLPDTDERTCFRCKGSGMEPKRNLADPMRVRYAVAKRLVASVDKGDVETILHAEIKSHSDLYWPVLGDVYARAIDAAEKVAGC